MREKDKWKHMHTRVECVYKSFWKTAQIERIDQKVRMVFIRQPTQPIYRRFFLGLV